MVNKLLLIITLLIFPSIFSYSADESSLKEIYGTRLFSTSIDIKYAFKRKTGVDWASSSYKQRKKFLISYQNNLEEQEKNDQKLAREESKKTLAEERAKRDQERSEQQALREKQRKETAKLKEENRTKARLKEHSNDISKQIDALKHRDKAR